MAVSISLDGQVAIVTGSGKATAVALAEAGADVAALFMN